MPPLFSALAARSAAAGAAATWGTNLVSQTATVQAVLRAPGTRRALALVAKLQAPARRWAQSVGTLVLGLAGGLLWSQSAQ